MGIAIILYGFPPGYGAVGTAALLNVPRSLVKFLQALQAQGYNLGTIPEDGEEIIQKVKFADDENLSKQNRLSIETLENWLGYLLTSRIEKHWKSLKDAGIKTIG